MNETLCSWTFNFHKVVRQQNSGAVADFILPYSAVYLRIDKWKNYWNRSTFAKVIVKIKVARFSMAHGVDLFACLGAVGPEMPTCPPPLIYDHVTHLCDDCANFCSGLSSFIRNQHVCSQYCTGKLSKILLHKTIDAAVSRPVQNRRQHRPN